ncbi:MAG TPA: hypothetical protein VM689_10075 [Aliidongia sp.]|nr:hypothetical protein [Aliidongia sp.]
MRGKILGIVVGAVVLVGGGLAAGYVWLQSQADHALQTGIETLKTHLPPNMKLDIAGMATHPFARSAEFTQVTIVDAAVPGSPLTIGHLVFSGLTPEGGGARAEHVVATDLKIADGDDPEGGMTVATITIDGMVIPPSSVGPYPVKDLRIDHGVIDRIAVSGKDRDGRVNATLGQMNVGALKDGKLGTIGLRDIHAVFTVSDGDLVDGTLKEASSTDIDVAALADGSYKKSQKTVISAVSLADLAVTKGSGRLGIAGVNFSVTAQDAEGRPSGLQGGIDGFHLVPPPAAEQLASLLKRLGRTDLALSFHTDCKQDFSARTAIVTETAVIDGMGDFTIESALGNLPDPKALADAQAEPAVAGMAAGLAMTLGPTRVSWTDRGLVPAVKVDLIDAKMSPEQFAQLSEASLRQLLAALGVAEQTADWPAKVTLFLTKPGHIELRLNPVQNVALGSLVDSSQPPAAKFGLLKPSLAVDTP